MKKKQHAPYWKVLAVLLNLAAIVILALGLVMLSRGGYSQDVWIDVIRGKSYLQSSGFQERASESVYDALQVVARSTRLERDGAYDPYKIIRVRDYLESRTVYDSIPESEKRDGICYRLDDLYQWSLKGASFGEDVLQEAYKPLFYGSIQEYANDSNEEYPVVINQISKAMNMLGKDVAEYEEQKKEWAFDAINVRYAFRDFGSGNICTNVPALLKADALEEDFEKYFKSLGSYYIFDSRSANVSQQNVGDYYSYNTYSLLTGWGIHLSGEYQVYVGIDTGFPVSDSMSAEAQEYEQARNALSSYGGPMIVSGVFLSLTLLFLLWKLAVCIRRALIFLMEHLHTALRVCIIFAGYELAQTLLRMLLGEGRVSDMMIFFFRLAVLALLVCEGIQRQRLLEGVQAMANGEEEWRIPTERLFFANRQMAEAVNDLGEGLRTALQEQMKSEHMKTDLITNVSHDLKTPLTSIINYVDLMKREQIESPKAREYLRILDQKSQRLKQLTEDLVEASRASSGNVTLDMRRIDLKELLMQISGEYEERFAARDLCLIPRYPEEPLYVKADGRRMWRIIENLYRNVEKYAMPCTRVYLDVGSEGDLAFMSLKNISEQPLNISADALTERFVRGDESRTTEGSGLGLSIARDLTELQNGTFSIYLDGDLFKATVSFPLLSAETSI